MHLRSTLLLLAISIAASLEAPRLAHEPIGAVTAELTGAGAASAIGNAAAKLASTATRSHVGFDTNVYPGDKAMDAWKRDGQYEWVGYYLDAPCHSDTSWSGKRAQLVNNGWGLAVIYVGQQTWGRSFAPTKRTITVHRKATRGHKARTYKMKRTTTIPVATSNDPRCSVSFVNAAQGKIDARDAISTANKEGFPKGAVIFLDVEYMASMPQRMRDYYRAWTRAVLADGRYKPGIYAANNDANTIYDDVSAEYDHAGVTSEPPFWITGTGGFDLDRQPTDVGHKFAMAWQGLLDVVREHNGVRLPVDISVSSVGSPSTE
ncbi:MAG TPA: glycoside hydrolase domain-containing protein [Gemmatimonadaceae bacterium]|nr:glycoside hydrolase domain-containing protein [Gemmatimonadaceae bacterium]